MAASSEDAFGDPLRDDAALQEIDLTTRLMIAASEKGGPLTDAEIDALLTMDAPNENVSNSAAEHLDP
jgi:hypothetical protein